MGPFVVLGVDKDADREQIEAAWAQRVIAARKNQVKVPLEDINWAREVVHDSERRTRAEVTSLNPDTADGTLRRLAERYGLADGGRSLLAALGRGKTPGRLHPGRGSAVARRGSQHGPAAGADPGNSRRRMAFGANHPGAARPVGLEPHSRIDQGHRTMNDESLSELSPPAKPQAAPSDGRTIWSSSLYKVCEELIALRERNNREHKMFEQVLAKQRDAIQGSFNSFAADTQRAYQQLRQEIHGEKRVSMALLNELLDIGMDLEHIVANRPSTDDRADRCRVGRRRRRRIAQGAGRPYAATASSPTMR